MKHDVNVNYQTYGEGDVYAIDANGEYQPSDYDDMEEQNTTALKISIRNLDKHMEIINKYLKNIKMALDVSMTSGCNFLKAIN